MNSKERVLAAINNKVIDRVPFDFWAEDVIWDKLFKHAGHKSKRKIMDQLQVDIRHIKAIEPVEKYYAEGIVENMWGERFTTKPSEWGLLREHTKGALVDAKSIDDLKNFNWPSNDLFDYSTIKEQCDRNEGYAVFYGFCDIWERPAMVRGIQNALCDFYENPDWVHFLSRKFTDFYKEDYSRAQKAANNRIDIFAVLTDLGTQTGSLVSDELFEEFIQPYLKEMADHIHNLGAKIMFHSCGTVTPFIDRLISIGIDILDPIQPTCDLMSPDSLKKYKGKICFHGGISMQGVLPKGTTEEVKQEVRKYADILGNNGGYIAGPAHLFQSDVPVENVIALYEAFNY